MLEDLVTHGTFKAICIRVMPKLMAEFEWEDFQAAGCMGNLGHECNGFTMLREVAYEHQPTRGGYGWAQWTGPRRVSFLHYCNVMHLDWHSEEANYGYLVKELNESYGHTVSAVAKARDVDSATVAFERGYEAAGVVSMGSRKRWARRALDALHSAPGVIEA